MAYQHYIQKAYIERWKYQGRLYVIDKHTRHPIAKQSAERILGANDMQTPEMESAFSEVEKHIGFTNEAKLITDPKKVKTLATWIALHAVRNRLNRDLLAERNYKAEVDRLAELFSLHYGHFLCVQQNLFITCDNPVVQWKNSITFYLMVLSPQMLILLIPKDNIVPKLEYRTINQCIYNAATEHCISFDDKLHMP